MMGLSVYVLACESTRYSSGRADNVDGLGPLLWAPLSEVRWIGRNPIYISTIIAFCIVSFITAVTALKSFRWFLFLRFIQGLVGSPCLANGGASMHDIFDEQELPYALGVWIAFAYAGPALGPAVAAKATEVQGWQFPMWFIAWLSIPVCILLYFLPETYLPKIMYKNGSYARIGDHNDKIPHNDSVWETLKDSLIKPIEISLKDPSVNFTNIYTSFCYAT